jgi:hypothetical protein
MPFQRLSERLLHLVCLCFGFIFEFRNFLSQLVNKFDILTDVTIKVEGIAGDFGLDFFGAITVFQRIVGFVVVERRRGDADYHDCFAVASKGKFEETGELRVAVGDVASSIGVAEGVDTVSQR